jgi:hypothetical protein
MENSIILENKIHAPIQEVWKAWTDVGNRFMHNYVAGWKATFENPEQLLNQK